mgnify:CR=1 FL=1
MMKIIKNNLYLFREICHADPWRIPYSFFNAVFCGVFQVFFYVYIIETKYPVFTGFFDRSVGIMQK